MTAQTATYGMDYLNHAQPKDVLVWIRMNTDILPNVGSKISKLFNHKGTLTIPCHQFAASVVGRLLESIYLCDYQKVVSLTWEQQEKTLHVMYDSLGEYGCILVNLPINPFHGMTMPDGSPRTSCTREEFEEWKKELDV